jgi:hypothetical protein
VKEGRDEVVKVVKGSRRKGSRGGGEKAQSGDKVKC